MTNEKIMSTICDSICRHPYRVESQAELDILCEDCVVNKLEASDGDLISRADIPYHKQLEPMGNGQYTEVEVAYKDDIESLPSAEAVQGEWIEVEDDYDNIYWECSNCEDAFVLEVGTPKDNNYNFCPNCGARMKGE